MRPIHTVEYYSTVQRNEPPIYAMTWMKLEKTMLSEEPEQKATYCLIPFIRNIQKRQICGGKTRLVVARNWVERGMGSNCVRGAEFPFGVMKSS